MTRREPGFLDFAWVAGLILAGLIMPVMGWSGLPRKRDALTAITVPAPVSVSLELIQDWSSRRSSSYRTQRIYLSAPQYGFKRFSPPKNLWVDDLDRIRAGQPVRFLVDPSRGLIYEATTDTQTLLAYRESAGKLSGHGWALIIVGLVFLGFGAFNGHRLLNHPG